MRPIPIIAAALLLAGSSLALAQGTHPSGIHIATAPVVMAREKAPHGAKVFFIAPKNGVHVGQDVVVKFGVKGMRVLPAGDLKPNSGHHHLLIDAKELPPLDAPIPNDATHKHYGKGQTEDTIHLEPGTHTLQLDFGDARHVQFDPPLVSKKFTIHVK
ncbi:MAG: DUF4399 domain-containing protein [Dokdonella sp.]